jgi:hypothetical protein
VGHLQGDKKRQFGRELLLGPGDPAAKLTEVQALDQLQGQKRTIVEDAVVHHPNQVGVVQPTGDLGLVGEGGELGLVDVEPTFQRQAPLHAVGVDADRLIHLGHAPSTQEPSQSIALVALGHPGHRLTWGRQKSARRSAVGGWDHDRRAMRPEEDRPTAEYSRGLSRRPFGPLPGASVAWPEMLLPERRDQDRRSLRGTRHDLTRWRH